MVRESSRPSPLMPNMGQMRTNILCEEHTAFLSPMTGTHLLAGIWAIYKLDKVIRIHKALADFPQNESHFFS